VDRAVIDMLDTPIRIDIINQRPPQVRARFERLRDGEVVLSSITGAELAFGVAKSGSARNRDALEKSCARWRVPTGRATRTRGRTPCLSRWPARDRVSPFAPSDLPRTTRRATAAAHRGQVHLNMYLEQPAMGQITLYIDDATQARLREAAASRAVSQSQFVAELIRHATDDRWPDSALALAGAVKDFPDAAALRSSGAADTPRPAL
jgi:hypothetical protein